LEREPSRLYDVTLARALHLFLGTEETTMYKLIRIALFALPLAAGTAWAQGSGTSGSAGAPGSQVTPPVTDDTRTPLQQKAGRIDDTTPAMPGDATKPVEIPNTVKDSNRTGLPEGTDMNTPGSGATDKKVHKKAIKKSESTLERKSGPVDDTTRTTKTDNKLDSDAVKDQLNSDK
jgi:hypothetical protein